MGKLQAGYLFPEIGKRRNAYLEANARPDIAALREEVETYAGDFHMPGGMY